MKCRSEWQSPATLVRISTSRGPGFGRLTSSIASGLLTSCRTAAFMWVSSFCYRSSFRGALFARTRNPEVAYDLWIPGSHRRGAPRNDGGFARTAHPGMPTLRGHKQFANLGHAGGAIAEQMIGDRALRGIFRGPERIV